MMDNKTLSDQLIAALKHQKRVSSVADLNDLVKEFPRQVQYLNSAERNACSVEGKLNFEDIPFPADLSSLIYPNSVTLTGRPNDYDFLEREGKVEGEFTPWTRADWIDFGTVFYGAFGRDPKFVSVAECRNDVLLADIVDRAAFEIGDMEYRCSVDVERAFPIPLCHMFKKASFYSEKVVDRSPEIIREIMTIIRSQK